MPVSVSNIVLKKRYSLERGKHPVLDLFLSFLVHFYLFYVFFFTTQRCSNPYRLKTAFSAKYCNFIIDFDLMDFFETNVSLHSLQLEAPPSTLRFSMPLCQRPLLCRGHVRHFSSLLHLKLFRRFKNGLSAVRQAIAKPLTQICYSKLCLVFKILNWLHPFIDKPNWHKIFQKLRWAHLSKLKRETYVQKYETYIGRTCTSLIVIVTVAK